MYGVVQLKPTLGSAELAAVNLRRQGFNNLFYPVFQERKVKRGRLEKVLTPVFSGYLFLEILEGVRWSVINSTFGCAKLLTRPAANGYNEPSPIAESFISQLKNCSDRHAEAWCLRPGTRVVIIRGPLINRNAMVTWSSEQRVRLLLEILGRDDVVVTLDAADVAAV